MPKEIIRTNLAPAPIGDFSQAWSVSGSRLILLSGQVSLDMNGNTVGVGDVALQTRTILQNIQTILEAAGAKMSDVVRLNIYVVNMAHFRAKTREVRREYFPGNFPANILVEVKALASPEYLVEMEATAAVD